MERVVFLVVSGCLWFGMATEILKKVGERMFENHPPHPKIEHMFVKKPSKITLFIGIFCMSVTKNKCSK